ncbi:hypothetical protein [[Mycoplasma] gypis]|uniref:Uncharacterized protein n=1 Tax=[Mycoplasma] gypis TaxID=92404 RepID=A0ABZ2RRA2_9BACT|nr:hypothetical protein [[Mycoplasma] gypis]MBN0919431.1 hypothetical protein [[Mycoplasma] gypis]
MSLDIYNFLKEIKKINVPPFWFEMLDEQTNHALLFSIQELNNFNYIYINDNLWRFNFKISLYSDKINRIQQLQLLTLIYNGLKEYTPQSENMTIVARAINNEIINETNKEISREFDNFIFDLTSQTYSISFELIIKKGATHD